MNKQRESVYTLRREILEGQIHIAEDEVTDSRGYLMATAEELLDSRMDQFANAEMDASEWDIPALRASCRRCSRSKSRITGASISTSSTPASCATCCGSAPRPGAHRV